jgi:hypothetical protein
MEISIQDLISLIALILSVTGILYTRKNIKLTKYIDTITNQRIKWVDCLRVDLSKILSLAKLSKEYSQTTESVENYLNSPESDEMDYEDRLELDESLSDLRKNKNLVLSKIQDIETLHLIDLVLLKLNTIDDCSLIMSLESLQEIILHRNYHLINNELIKSLQNESKLLLKNEWERIKQETKNGREASKKRKIKFWS